MLERETDSIMNRVRALLRVIEDTSNATEHERANAQRLLDRLMKNYSLSIDDFDRDKRVERKFTCKSKYEFDLWLHVVGKVLGITSIEYRKRRTTYYIDMTQAEYIDTMNMLDVLKPALKQTIEDAVMAFLRVNELLAPAGEDGTAEIPNEELLKWWARVVKLSNQLQPSYTNKQLENGR